MMFPPRSGHSKAMMLNSVIMAVVTQKAVPFFMYPSHELQAASIGRYGGNFIRMEKLNDIKQARLAA